MRVVLEAGSGIRGQSCRSALAFSDLYSDEYKIERTQKKSDSTASPLRPTPREYFMLREEELGSSLV
jgi:hypothetical protein